MTNLSGQSIGRYHILEQLGEGGMATVYKAYDTRLEREVAVKVLRTEQFIPAQLQMVLQRFEREAKSLAKLSHPNIVNILDYGEHEGMPYLAMEYMPGGTLKQKLGQALPWQEAVRLLIPVAQGLAYAHGRGIIHRDVKPANILLKESGAPVLTDFGIAKLLEATEGHTLTGSGVGIGTPEYMAPEQGMGAKTIDARADIYSLGIVLYEMVTGRKPYVADTPMAVVLKQMTDPLPRPTDFAPGLPERVEYLLLKALAKQPDDRYPDMNAMIAAMEDLLAEVPTTPVAIAPASTVAAPSRQAKKKAGARPRLYSRMLVVVGVVSAFILLAVFGLPWLKKQIPVLPAAPINPVAPTATLTTSAMTFTPAKATLTVTPTASPTPTAVPLRWKQISDGKEFSRDTVVDIAFDPKDANAIYIRTQSSGIYKSSDGGLSWEPATSGPGQLRYTSAPGYSGNDSKGAVILKDPSGQLVFRIRENYLEKSNDGGVTWNTVETLQFLGTQPLSAVMVFQPTDHQVIYFGENNQLFKSVNAGNQWQKLFSFPSDFISKIAFSPLDPSTIFVGTQGLFLSRNSGRSWQEIRNGIGAPRLDLLINPDTSTLFILEKLNENGNEYIRRIYRSTDNGKTWSLTINTLGLSLSIGASNEMFYVYNSYNTVLKSTNDGKNWNYLYRHNPDKDSYYFDAIFFHPKNPKILYETWHDTSILRISLDGGNTWENTNSPTGIKNLYFDHSQGQVVYAIGDSGILRSSDGGQSWIRCRSVVTSTLSESVLAIDPQNSNLVYVGVKGTGIYVSHDGCISWSSKSGKNGLPDYHININSTATDPNISNVVYVGTQAGAYVSYDQGENWSRIDDGLVGSTIVYSIAVDSQSNVYATTPFGVFKLEKK